MSKPVVYALTLNWNGRDITVECVESILKSEYPNIKIVVIDNGSTDDSVPALRKKFDRRIEIIENRRNLGYAEGFNKGLQYGFDKGNADYCLVMNNDTIIDASAIGELVKVAETDKTIGFVTGKVYFYDHPDTLQTVGKKEDNIRWSGDHIGFNENDEGQYDTVSERFFADDIFTLVRRHLYEEIGGYNPLFFLQGEEYDWQARAKTRGYKIMFTPYAKLWHRVSVTLGRDSAKKAYYDARNPMLVILLHKPVWFFRRYLRHHVWHLILVAVRYTKRLQFDIAYKGFQGLLSGLLWGLRNGKLTVRHFV